MPVAMLDGIETYYETHGSGLPLLMCAPGGFDASIDKWRVASAWTSIDAIKALAAEHCVVVYDRRECGQSHGRVEPLTHATSGAHYLRELLPKSEFWNVMPPEQTTQKICDRILEFCRVHG